MGTWPFCTVSMGTKCTHKAKVIQNINIIHLVLKWYWNILKIDHITHWFFFIRKESYFITHKNISSCDARRWYLHFYFAEEATLFSFYCFSFYMSSFFWIKNNKSLICKYFEWVQTWNKAWIVRFTRICIMSIENSILSNVHYIVLAFTRRFVFLIVHIFRFSVFLIV